MKRSIVKVSIHEDPFYFQIEYLPVMSETPVELVVLENFQESTVPKAFITKHGYNCHITAEHALFFDNEEDFRRLQNNVVEQYLSMIEDDINHYESLLGTIEEDYETQEMLNRYMYEGVQRDTDKTHILTTLRFVTPFDSRFTPQAVDLVEAEVEGHVRISDPYDETYGLILDNSPYHKDVVRDGLWVDSKIPYIQVFTSKETSFEEMNVQLDSLLSLMSDRYENLLIQLATTKNFILDNLHNIQSLFKESHILHYSKNVK